jgi:hypothetical protein
VALRPQLSESLALGDSPAGEAAALRVLAADIDMDSVDLERSAAIQGQDSALAAFHLRKKNPAESEAEEREDCCE